MTRSLVVMNAMCHLQHVEAEGLVLRAEHTQLRHALHRPGNTASVYIRTYTHSGRMHTRAHVQHEWRAQARVYAPSPGPIRPLVKASMRARDTYTMCPRNKLSIAVVSEISRRNFRARSNAFSANLSSYPYFINNL